MMAREAYEKELNIYTLAQVASVAEKSADKDRYDEYMCSQCGDLYSGDGYRVIKFPLPGPTPTFNPVVVKKVTPCYYTRTNMAFKDF